MMKVILLLLLQVEPCLLSPTWLCSVGPIKKTQVEGPDCLGQVVLIAQRKYQEQKPQ